MAYWFDKQLGACYKILDEYKNSVDCSHHFTARCYAERHCKLALELATTHSLHYLLPKQTEHSYSLRSRSHNFLVCMMTEILLIGCFLRHTIQFNVLCVNVSSLNVCCFDCILSISSLLHWCVLSETSIGFFRSACCPVVQPFHRRKTGISSFRCQLLEQSSITRHMRTVARGTPAASEDISLPPVISGSDYLTFLLPHCGPCDNFCYLGHIKKISRWW